MFLIFFQKINGRNAITPAQCPTYFVQFPRNKTEWTLPPVDTSDLSAVPEENSCLNSERGSSPTNKSTSSYSKHSYGENNNLIGNSTITLEDINDEELDPTAYAETEFDERPPKPRAWLHNPNACAFDSNHYNKRNRINYRDLPARRPPTSGLSRTTKTNNNNNNRRGRLSDEISPPPPYDEDDHSCGGRRCRSNHTQHTSQSHEQPRHTSSAPVGQLDVQMDSNNRVTTKIKATVTMEVEYSHPNVPSRYQSPYIFYRLKLKFVNIFFMH